VGKRGDEDSLAARLHQWRKGVVVVEEVSVTRGEGGWSICGSNGIDGEPGRPEAELAKNGDGGSDLSRPGLLQCRGGGP
jgi:hypothetical protein